MDFIDVTGSSGRVYRFRSALELPSGAGNLIATSGTPSGGLCDGVEPERRDPDT